MAVSQDLKVTSLQAQAMLGQKERVVNALAMFRPTAQQEPFFLTFSMDMILEILLGGGNRCLHGSTEIFDPVSGLTTSIDQIEGDFHVNSKDPATGMSVVADASKPFIKGYDDFYTVSLSNGQSLVVTKEHRVLRKDGCWTSIARLEQSSLCPLASTEDTFLSGFQRDDPHSTETPQDYRSSCLRCFRPYDGQPRSGASISQGVSPLGFDAQACTECACEHADGLQRKSHSSHPSRRGDHLSIQGDSLHAEVQSGALQTHSSSQPYSLPSDLLDVAGFPQDDPLSAVASFHPARTTLASAQPANQTCVPPDVSLNSVYITSVTYHSHGPVWDITVPGVNNYCLSGILNHNSGKSTCAAVSMASFLLNQPVTFRDGTKHYMRPERWRSEAVKVWIIGYDWKHIGKTIQRLLLQKDLFRVIRDQVTGKFRTWNPDAPEDKDLFHITRASPPLIRPSDIVGGMDGISWENKKDKQVSAFDLAHDGTRIEFFASTGSKPQGDPAHLIWMDEKIEDESWYSELLVRLIDYRGRLLWTTWPTTAPSAAMSEASERAELQIGTVDRTSFSFVLKGSDNPYTRSEHRDKIFATMDEDTRAARDEGKLGVERWRVYARFSRFVHRVLSNDPTTDDELAKAVRKINGIPGDWTRYLILDPGTANPAVLFVAVPPPALGDFVVPYDELYLHYTPAKQLAEAIAAKTKGQFFEDFIIDSHAARQTPMGFDGTIGANYEKEFVNQKLRCRRQGSRFSFGSDNVTGRILRLQGLLNIRGDGTPALRLLGCPSLVKQLEQYKWKPDPKGNPTDKPADYQKIDIACCLEYLVSRDDCSYVKPPAQKLFDSRSPAEIKKQIRSFFGRPDDRSPKDDSIYCGAGARPSF